MIFILKRNYNVLEHDNILSSNFLLKCGFIKTYISLVINQANEEGVWLIQYTSVCHI